MPQMSSPQRVAACIEYCGAHYHGWQRQKNARSVQGEVEKAISKVANESITVITAGRTDTGVHGIGQIIHFDTMSQRDAYHWLRGVNTYLPDDISLIWTRNVSSDFHARFSARERRYRYVILNRPVSPSYLHGRVTWHPIPLNPDRMRQAVPALLGRHNFNAYRAAGCQSLDPVKEVRTLTVTDSGPWIWLDIAADGFLHHMVRNIAGVLMRIGEGLAPTEWAGEVLRSEDRTQGGVTAPAHGLYFVSVQYSEKYELPETPEVCRFW